MPAVILIIAMFWAGVFGLYKAFNPAQAATSQTLTLSGTVPEKGYSIQNGYLVVSPGFIATIESKDKMVIVSPGTKYKLDSLSGSYTITIEAL